jgi:hypothetical protein
MKIQCSCGAKYAFEATPEMLQNPIRFVCQKCGVDSSDYVNGLIRQELVARPPAAAPVPVAPSLRVVTPGSAAPPAPVAPVAEAPRLKVAHEQLSAPVEEKAAAPASKYCPKHRRNLATYRCLVCQKPMCPECMKLFGYVCSPLCKARAEAEKINIPVYAGQSAVAEAQFWRKTGAVFGTIVTLLVLAVGFWVWYEFIGSKPHPAFSVRFDEPALSGASRLVGKDQLVFLHGGTLARYDLKTKKQVWSQELVTPQPVTDAIAAELQLVVNGQNVWVSSRDKLTHYNWDTGKAFQEIPFAYGSGRVVAEGDELIMLEDMTGGQLLVAHVNPASGETRTEVIDQPGTVATIGENANNTGNPATSGLPMSPGADAGRPMNPALVAQQAQNLPLPERIALPAILVNSAHQESIQAEINGQDAARPGSQTSAAQARQARLARGTNFFMLVPGKYGFVQFSVGLLESRIITRQAMKAAPQKSTLDGDLNVTKTADVANETLNEMQRNRGGDTVQEDESRYLVSLHRPDSTGAADWTGEVVGPPSVLSLKTVNVLVAGKTVIVLDKSDKKLWQAEFTYNIPGGDDLAGEESPFGEGPVVERGDTLYVFDQAVLTAFDLATGNARWRLPSVGVVGLFFDDQGMLYVNTTTADPDNIKYSRQIDVTQKIEASLFKIDPQTGRTLWNTKPGGFISYLSGKFIYTVEIYDPGEEENKVADLAGITPTPPHVQIHRINPKNGQIMWEHYQERAPLDVQFKDNSIELVFKKEVQVLKFLSF